MKLLHQKELDIFLLSQEAGYYGDMVSSYIEWMSIQKRIVNATEKGADTCISFSLIASDDATKIEAGTFAMQIFHKVLNDWVLACTVKRPGRDMQWNVVFIDTDHLVYLLQAAQLMKSVKDSAQDKLAQLTALKSSDEPSKEHLAEVRKLLRVK